MGLRLQIFIAVLLVLAILWIANMVRKEKLNLKFALPWLAVGVIVLIMDVFPGIMNWLVHILGIELPVNMLFFFGFCLTLYLVFILTVKASKQEEQIKRLTQEFALLEKSMEKNEDTKA